MVWLTTHDLRPISLSSCLNVWKGEDKNNEAAQQAFLERCRVNGEAQVIYVDVCMCVRCSDKEDVCVAKSVLLSSNRCTCILKSNSWVHTKEAPATQKACSNQITPIDRFPPVFGNVIFARILNNFKLSIAHLSPEMILPLCEYFTLSCE